MVVAEAEQPGRLPEDLLERYLHHVWVGDIAFKGLLVMAKAEHALRLMDGHNPQHQYVLPVEVGVEQPLTLVAVWTQRDKQRTYTEHLWHGLHEYEELLKDDGVIIGDFTRTPSGTRSTSAMSPTLKSLSGWAHPITTASITLLEARHREQSQPRHTRFDAIRRRCSISTTRLCPARSWLARAWRFRLSISG
jgi:hypothetical protein